jgi:molecular chaperone GrpE
MERDETTPGGPAGPSGEGELQDVTTEADELDLAALAAELDDVAHGADRIEQSAEDAVAEAVELARRFETERDDLRDLVQRIQADFENYKRRVDAQHTEFRAQAAADLVRELLPVLDACDAAMAQGREDVAPVQTQLIQTLEKRGLSKVDADGVPFDPNVHEAVLHDDGEGDDDGPVVVEVMRAGYLWNQRVVRPAMVKVRG